MADNAADDKPEERTEENNVVPKSIKKMITEPGDLYSYMTSDSDAVRVIKPISWEVTGLIMAHLKDEAVFKDLTLYEKCLAKVAELSSPKELYLGILEHFDPSTEAKHVELLIPGLSTVINKLYREDISVCATILETTYSTLSYYVDSLNLPEYKTFDPLQKREKVFEAKKIELFLSKIFQVLAPVIRSHCGNMDKSSQDFNQFQSHTFRYLCHALVVLGQLDLESGEESTPLNEAENLKINCAGESPSPDHDSDKQQCRVISIAIDTMETIHLLHSTSILWELANWCHLHPKEEQSDEGRVESEKQAERARACFLYLLFSKKLLLDSFPHVYSHQWLLVKAMPSLRTLLSCENQCVVWKGLEMLAYILERAQEGLFSYTQIHYQVRNICGVTQNESKTTNSIKALFQDLINIAIYLPSKPVRSRAVHHLTEFLDKFVWSDKYFLIMHLLKSTEHSGVCGLLIGYLKDKLNQILRDDPPNGHQDFGNVKRMTVLFDTIFSLPDGAETDLLVEFDRIMAALNLLRFVIIRDKENRTGIKNHHRKIERIFLKPLRTGLDVSRAHYENELRKYGKKRTTPEKNMNNEPEFSVNGMPLPSLPIKEQKNTLEAALHSFDMMQIVAIRVAELMG